jgi:trigger factor
MSVHVETLDKLERRITLTLPAATIASEVESRLRRLSRTVRADGFRPGKVPMSVVAQRYGYSVHSEVLNDKVGQVFNDAVTEAKLRVAGAPRITEKTEAPEGEVAFDATFEVYPEVKLGDLGQAEVERVTTEVNDEAVDKTIAILQKQRRTFQQRPAAEGAAESDRVTIDFAGSVDGVPFEGGKAEDFPFVLGQGRMLPEFEEAARGLKAGETKVFELKFPDDYQGVEVAGKTAEFTITVKEVAEGVLPELNGEFAKSLGQAEGDIEKLKADIRSNIEREVKVRSAGRTKSSVMDALVEAGKFDVPKSLVDNDVQGRVAAAREELKQRGIPNAESVPIPAEAFSTESERRVRLGLLVSELVKQAQLQAKPEQVRARIEEFAENYEQPAQVVSYYLADRQRRAEIEAIVLEDNVVAHVLEKAKVTEEKVPFDQLMGMA